MATNPLAGVQEIIDDPEGVQIGGVTTDEDGRYMFEYKHRGRPADYTVSLPDHGMSA